MRKLWEQILRFGFVGFLCFFIDYGIMEILYRLVGIDPVISSGISFSISTVVNYVLSVTLVFETDKNKNKLKEFVVFVFLSVVGLGVNQLGMWIGVHILKWLPEIVKIGVTAIVMVYNFISRKLFIEKKKK